MDVALPSFVLGYHGCDADVAEQVISGQRKLKPSQNEYDWLGEGIYFWEHNAQRAYDFAKQMQKRPHPSGQQITKPAVIGAVIDLGFCLNMLDSTSIDLVRNAHKELVTLFEALNQPLPVNAGGPDRVNRQLDCAVVNLLHRGREDQGDRAFESVRAAFFEDRPLYDGAGFAKGNHIQIAVRDQARILGYFRPLDEKGKPRKFT